MASEKRIRRASGPPADSSPDPRLQRILATVDSIPRGRVATYGQVAEEAGLAGRARLVGRVLGQLPAGSKLPWHRVVNAAGELRAPRSADEQHMRLAAEGVPFGTRGRVQLRAARWDPDSA